MNQHELQDIQEQARRDVVSFDRRENLSGGFSLFGAANTVGSIGQASPRPLVPVGFYPAHSMRVPTFGVGPDQRLMRPLQQGGLPPSQRQFGEFPAMTAHQPCTTDEGAANLGRITGPVRVLHKVADQWGLSPNELANLLAYPNPNTATDLLAGRISLREEDREDRVRLLFRIYRVLSSLFTDAARQREWIRTPNPQLANKSPLEFMIVRRIPGMVSVRNLVERFAGR